MVGVGLTWDAIHTRRKGRTPVARPPDRSRWLWLAAAASAGAAAVHFAVMPEHFGEAALYGAFFAVCATAQVVGAVILAWQPTRIVVSLSVLGNAAVIALWLVTRLIAIPLGPGAGETESFGYLDVTASACELVVVLACASWLTNRRHAEPAEPFPVGPVHALGAR